MRPNSPLTAMALAEAPPWVMRPYTDKPAAQPRTSQAAPRLSFEA